MKGARRRPFSLHPPSHFPSGTAGHDPPHDTRHNLLLVVLAQDRRTPPLSSWAFCSLFFTRPFPGDLVRRPSRISQYAKLRAALARSNVTVLCVSCRRVRCYRTDLSDHQVICFANILPKTSFSFYFCGVNHHLKLAVALICSRRRCSR